MFASSNLIAVYLTPAMAKIYGYLSCMPHIHKIILERREYASVAVTDEELSELEGRSDENIADYLDRIKPQNVKWGCGVARKVAQIDEWYDEKYTKVDCPKCQQTVVPTYYNSCPYCHTDLKSQMCITVHVEDGVCQDVTGLPKGWKYEVDDKD